MELEYEKIDMICLILSSGVVLVLDNVQEEMTRWWLCVL